MHTDYAGSPWRYHSPHSIWIEVVCHRVDVGEYRGDTLPIQRVCGRYEGVRRNDHFAFKPEGTYRYLQRDRAVAHSDAVLNPEALGDLGLEFLNQRPIVA